MSDYSDWLANQQRQALPVNPRHREQQEEVARRMEALLKGDEWETFRGLVQGMIDDAESAMAPLRAVVEESHAVGEALSTAASRMREYRARIVALRDVLAIPREVLAETKVAT